MTVARISLGKQLIAGIISAILLGWTGGAGATSFDQSYAGYDLVLQQYVVDGRVDYQGLKADTTQLDHFLDSVAGVAEGEFSAWSEAERLTYLINLYNAATLKLIVENYPVDGIKDIGSFFKGPWSQPVVRLFGETITLDDVEHEIIRKQYDEPRIHLVLVCAAKSCPPLRSEAYLPDRLDEQLDQQSRGFLRSSDGLQIDRDKQVVSVSSIFKWYGDDFVAGYAPSSGFTGLNKAEQAVANFCSGYLPAADSQYLRAGGYKIRYLNYDWSLNEPER